MRLSQAAVLNVSSSGEAPGESVSWISVSDRNHGSYVVAYRLQFNLSEAARIRVHLTADQRYRFFVDGNLEGEGPERGDLHCWYYQSYDLALAAGEHSFVALVWTLEPGVGIVPTAQMTLRHGFVLAGDAPFSRLVSTGLASWECRRLEGVRFLPSGLTGAGMCGGGVVEIDGANFPWGIERGEGEGWTAAIVTGPIATRLSTEDWGLVQGPLLTPGILPPPHSERHRFEKVRYVGLYPSRERYLLVDPDHTVPEAESLTAAFAEGNSVRIEAHRSLWILVDLENYYCGYPEVSVKGGSGATVRVLWAEGLFESLAAAQERDRPHKGNRDQIEGKFFFGRGDTFKIGPNSDPTVLYTSFWWSCGRYVALTVETADEPLTLRWAGLRESRYPIVPRARIELANEAFSRASGIMLRSLQMCSHETYMDCPYYEQLNYTGDTRVQALTTYAMTGDDRLAKKCIELFSNSMMPNGLTQSRYPASDPQIIPQFSLYWVCMLYDYALWRGDANFVRRFLPRIRCVLDTFLAHVEADGLLRCPDGWDWVDWCREWEADWSHSHPKGPEGASAVNQLQLVYTLGLATRLEQWVGKKVFAEHYAAEQAGLWETAVKVFWNDERGLFASTSAHEIFDEHAQCFAILSGLLDDKRVCALRRSLIEAPDLSRATYYFQFYLFSAYAVLGLSHRIIKRLDGWSRMVDLGLRTTLESPDPSRSDCHAWSSHPLYHAIVSLCGVQPDSFGFERVRIAPELCTLESASVLVPHHRGPISVAWKWNRETAVVEVDLPDRLEGTIHLLGSTYELVSGPQTFEVSVSPELVHALNEGKWTATPDLLVRARAIQCVRSEA